MSGKRSASSSVTGAKIQRAKTEITEDAKQQSLQKYIYYGLGNNCLSETTKANAQLLKDEWKKAKSLSEDAGVKFALKFFETKKSKDFAWAKNYVETYKVQEKSIQGVKETYLTPF